MSNISEAYASPRPVEPRRRTVWVIALGLLIATALGAALLRTGRNVSQYQRMSEAIKNYDTVR